MKKRMLTLLAVLMVSTTVFSQIRFGITGGANLSSIEFSANSENPMINIDPASFNGFSLGPTMEAILPVIGLGIDASVLYSRKGFSYNVESNQVIFNEFARVDYIDVPVRLKWKFGLPVLKVFLAAGPTFNYLISNSSKLENIINKDARFDIGLTVGGGIELFKVLQVGVSHIWGFNETFSFKDGFSNNGGSNTMNTLGTGKSRYWTFSATVLF